MLNNSSRDGRQNYLTACDQLIEANYTDDYKKNNGITGTMTQVQRKAMIEYYMGKINHQEITQGYLWMSAQAQPLSQQIQFSVVDTQRINGSPITAMNRLLTMQDSFLISDLAYFLQNFQCISGQTNNVDFSPTGNNWEPICYPCAWFNNGIAVNFDPACGMFWMGAFLKLTINQKVVIPYWDCLQHYKAPITQYSPSIVSPSAYIPNQKNNYDGSEDGFVYMQPNVVIGGGRNNILQLFLPANIPATIAPFSAAAYNTTFLLYFNVFTRGILMQNSTTVK